MDLIGGTGYGPQTLYNFAETTLFPTSPSLKPRTLNVSYLFVFPLLGLLETEVTILIICHLKKGRFIALTKKVLVTIAILYPSAKTKPLLQGLQHTIHMSPGPTLFSPALQRCSQWSCIFALKGSTEDGAPMKGQHTDPQSQGTQLLVWAHYSYCGTDGCHAK